MLHAKPNLVIRIVVARTQRIFIFLQWNMYYCLFIAKPRSHFNSTVGKKSRDVFMEKRMEIRTSDLIPHAEYFVQWWTDSVLSNYMSPYSFLLCEKCIHFNKPSEYVHEQSWRKIRNSALINEKQKKRHKPALNTDEHDHIQGMALVKLNLCVGSFPKSSNSEKIKTKTKIPLSRQQVFTNGNIKSSTYMNCLKKTILFI